MHILFCGLPMDSATTTTDQGDKDLPELIADRFQPTHLLGAGSFGQTFAAHDRQTGADVALKLLSFEHLSDWKSLELFEREAQILKRLDHPHIPDYVDYACGQGEGESFLVQQLAPGQSLQQLLDEGRQFNEGECVQIARQALDILAYLEARKPPVVHRDIKPENLLWDGADLYLVDFGSVREVIDPDGVGSTVAGTFGYMAPEQMRGQATPASDIYGLGMTLIHLLTAVAPDRLPERRMRPQYRDRVQVSGALAQVLDKMIEPVAEDRIQSASRCLELWQHVDGVDHIALAEPGDSQLQARVATEENRRRQAQQQRQLEKKEKSLSVVDQAGHHLHVTARGNHHFVIEFSPPPERPFLPEDVHISREKLLYSSLCAVIIPLIVVPVFAALYLLIDAPFWTTLFATLIAIGSTFGIPAACLGLVGLHAYQKRVSRQGVKLTIEGDSFALLTAHPYDTELLGRADDLRVELYNGPHSSFGRATFSHQRQSRQIENFTPAELAELEAVLRRSKVSLDSRL